MDSWHYEVVYLSCFYHYIKTVIQKHTLNRDKTQNSLLCNNKESYTPDSQFLKLKQKNPQIIWGLSLEETNLKNLVLAKNIKSSLADSYKGL